MSLIPIPTRTEHIEWCKQRAYEYLKTDNYHNAVASLQSDLRKHPETANHSAIELSCMLQMNRRLTTPDKVRKFIDGIY